MTQTTPKTSPNKDYSDFPADFPYDAYSMPPEGETLEQFFERMKLAGKAVGDFQSLEEDDLDCLRLTQASELHLANEAKEHTMVFSHAGSMYERYPDGSFEHVKKLSNE